jgi:hypothetical protein
LKLPPNSSFMGWISIDNTWGLLIARISWL